MAGVYIVYEYNKQFVAHDFNKENMVFKSNEIAIRWILENARK